MPITLKEPSFVDPEISNYVPVFFQPLENRGFVITKQPPSGSGRIDITFDPSIFSTQIDIKLLTSDGQIVAEAIATNNGWGTGIARQTAISNLARSAADQFALQLSKVRIDIEKANPR
ncbi:MAG: hypothetical protein G3I10_02135 [Ferrovum sp.]|nr:hypothetical protein [Ferrovum sp.]